MEKFSFSEWYDKYCEQQVDDPRTNSLPKNPLTEEEHEEIRKRVWEMTMPEMCTRLIDYLEQERLSSRRSHQIFDPMEVDSQPLRRGVLSDKFQILFLTMTHRAEGSDDRQEPMFRSRIARMISQRSYPIVRWYGCLAHTAKGVLHAHLVLVHLLKRLPSGKYDYPKPSLYRRYNQGELVNIKRVNSLLGAECLRNYIREQEHDTQESLIYLGEEEKFFEWLKQNECLLWGSQVSGGSGRLDKESE